jgi:nucleoside-diphosphate-sugar epimerase
VTDGTLVIGATGYVGRTIVDLYREGGAEVTGTSRRGGTFDPIADGVDLDRLLERKNFDQVVLTPQLTAPGVDWLIDRVDGPRWVVLSSAQLASTTPAPGTSLALAREETALARGATVLRPTMIFGRAGDANVSRMIRMQQRWRVTIQIGDGCQLVQPLHVDDLVALLMDHRRQARPGVFGVGGNDRVPIRELVDMVRDLLALRLPVVRVPRQILHLVARLGMPGVRPDQVRRLQENKIVDTAATCETFGWDPKPLAQRLEQAVWEVTRNP